MNKETHVSTDAIEERIFKQLKKRVVEEDSLEKVIKNILDWQKIQFPHATQKSRATHLLREAAELYVKPNDAEEAVDIIFLAVAIIEASEESLNDVLNKKLTINKARKWGERDESGVVEHLEKGEQTEWTGMSNREINMRLTGEVLG